MAGQRSKCGNTKTSERGGYGRVVDKQRSVELKRVGVPIDQSNVSSRILQRSARKTQLAD